MVPLDTWGDLSLPRYHIFCDVHRGFWSVAVAAVFRRFLDEFPSFWVDRISFPIVLDPCGSIGAVGFLLRAFCDDARTWFVTGVCFSWSHFAVWSFSLTFLPFPIVRATVGIVGNCLAVYTTVLVSFGPFWLEFGTVVRRLILPWSFSSCHKGFGRWNFALSPVSLVFLSINWYWALLELSQPFVSRLDR